MSIAQNQALFSLLGTVYGGNGQTTFALPNLQGRVPLGFSLNYPQGLSGGEAQHTLSVSEIPHHTHVAMGTSIVSGGTNVGAGDYFGGSSVNIYAPPTNPVFLDQETVSLVGGSQGHANMMPFLALSFCVALVGIYPARN